MSGVDLARSELIPRDKDAARRELAGDLVKAAYLRGDFLLSAGNRSTYYFDKYLFETRPSILRRLGTALAALVPDDTDRLAAPELGAVLLGGAVSLELGLPLVIVKKNPNEYGAVRTTEGELHAGERVCLIEDVITTGTQAIRAARRLTEANAVVNSLVVVLDREEGGESRISEAGLRYRPLFRKRDLIA